MFVTFLLCCLVQLSLTKKQDWCVKFADIDNLNGDWIKRTKEGTTYYTEQGKGTRVLQYAQLVTSNSTAETWSFRNTINADDTISYCLNFSNVTQLSLDPNYCKLWMGENVTDTNITFRECNAKKNDYNYDFLLEKASSGQLITSSIVSGSVFCLWLIFIILGKCKNEYYESSTLDTYNKIFLAKGQKPYEIPPNMKKPAGELALRCDLKNNKKIWSNDFCLDFLFSIKINHALISLFIGHPNHTYTRCVRFVIFLAILAANMSITAFTLAAIADEPENERDSLNNIFGVFFGILMFVFEKIISMAGQCQCDDTKHYCLRCCCNTFRCFLLTSAYIGLGCWFIISMVLFGISGTTSKVWGHMIWTFSVSSFQSWFIIAIFLGFVIFFFDWQSFHPKNNPKDIYAPEKMIIFGNEIPCIVNKRCNNKINCIFKIISKLTCSLLFKEKTFDINNLDGSDKYEISHYVYLKYKQGTLEPIADEIDLVVKFSGQNFTKHISSTFTKKDLDDEKKAGNKNTQKKI